MERNVTRTIEKRNYQALVYDLATNNSFTKDYVLTEKPKDNDEALKLLRKRFENESFKVCAITSAGVEEQLYSLSEVDFLKYAKPADEKQGNERCVNRTIQKKVYKTLVYDNESKQTKEADFTLTEKIKDNDEALKLLRKRYEGMTLKVCAILDTKIEEKLYSLSEVDFLKYAKVVDKSKEEG